MSSKANELLSSMTGGNAELGDAILGEMMLGVSSYGPGGVAEGNIVIGYDRYITVPEVLKRIAVEHDHNVETVTFDCPRYWDNHDLSEMKIYINYSRSDGHLGSYPVDNSVTIDDSDENIIHFDWTISREVTDVKGGIAFLVCAKRVEDDGNETTHWNSELNKDMYVSEGLEVIDHIVQDYPDLITYLLTRMDDVEAKTTLDSMLGYLDEYFATDATINDVLLNYVEGYLANDPETKSSIIEIVHDYINTHLAVTDKTLTLDGGIADAKATGDAIEQVNSRLAVKSFEGLDFNGIMVTGIYDSADTPSTSGAQGYPVDVTGLLVVNNANNNTSQTYVCHSGQVYTRAKFAENTEWSGWEKHITANDFTVSGDTLILNFL